jgi:hypothetical protein
MSKKISILRLIKDFMVNVKHNQYLKQFGTLQLVTGEISGSAYVP